MYCIKSIYVITKKLFPFISFNEKDVDKKMHTIMGKEKTFTIAVKKTKEKV
jgi:hypothetical protein